MAQESLEGLAKHIQQVRDFVSAADVAGATEDFAGAIQQAKQHIESTSAHVDGVRLMIKRGKALISMS